MSTASLLPQLAEFQKMPQVERFMPQGIFPETACRQRQQASSGRQPARVRRVLWKACLFLKMNESPRELYEPLIEASVGIVTTQPEMLQHIMSFVVLRLVEAIKEGAVFARKGLLGSGGLVGLPFLEPGF